MALGGLWSLALPFNKPVWTGSYIVFTAGCGALALAALFLLIDVAGWRRPAFPLVVFGSNAIVAYVAPILVKIHVLQEWLWPPSGPGPSSAPSSLQQAIQQALVADFGRVRGGWLYTLGYIGVWWLILFVLYRKRIFLRV